MRHSTKTLFTTFQIGSDVCAINVMGVQEVARAHSIAPVPLAPKFVRGLVNLRGQIATAIGLGELFNIASSQGQQEAEMSVICDIEGHLISFCVDSIGDVLEIDESTLQPPPETVPTEIRKYIQGIYQFNNSFVSILDLKKLSQELSLGNENIQNLSSLKGA